MSGSTLSIVLIVRLPVLQVDWRQFLWEKVKDQFIELLSPTDKESNDGESN